MAPVKGSPTPPPMPESPLDRIDPKDPRVKKLVYTLYRGMLTSENQEANGIMKKKDPKTVTQSQGVAPIVQTLMGKERRRADGELASTGGSTLTFESLHPRRTNVAEISDAFAPISPNAPHSYKQDFVGFEGAIGNSMLKEKKPFTYTPKGFATPNFTTTRLTHSQNTPLVKTTTKPTPTAPNGTGFKSYNSNDNAWMSQPARHSQQPNKPMPMVIAKNGIPSPPSMFASLATNNNGGTRCLTTTTTTTSSSYIMSTETTTMQIKKTHNSGLSKTTNNASSNNNRQHVPESSIVLANKRNNVILGSVNSNDHSKSISKTPNNGQSNSLSKGPNIGHSNNLNGLSNSNGHSNGLSKGLGNNGFYTNGLVNNGQSKGLGNDHGNGLRNVGNGGSKLNWRDPQNLSCETKMMKQLEIETMKRVQQSQSAEIPMRNERNSNGIETKVNGANKHNLNFARMNLSK